MNDEIVPRYAHTFRRRKRSVLGKDWAVPTLQDTRAGVWCSACKKRHSYNGHGKLVSRYERQGEAWVLYWLCPITGNHVGEIWLSGG